MMKQDLITVFGGAGFLGCHVVRELARAGYRVRVAIRRPDLAGHVLPLGAPGQIHLAQANIRYPQSIDQALNQASGVVNLVAILHNSGKQSFEAVHHEGAKNIAERAKVSGIKNFVHVSAIGADQESDSHYQSSKALGEDAVLSAIKSAVILRPSILFGDGDGFFSRFAHMASTTSIIPYVGDGASLFQPVYVGDVAKAVLKAIDGEAKAGKIYELGGPEIKSYKELLEILVAHTNPKTQLISLPVPLAKIMAFFARLLPAPPLTSDQIKMLQVDNVVSDKAKKAKLTLQGLGIEPAAMASILPSYLYCYKPKAQYAKGSSSYIAR